MSGDIIFNAKKHYYYVFNTPNAHEKRKNKYCHHR